MGFIRRSARIILKTTKLRPLLVAHRHRGIQPNDVFIASYPRSGNTWLRFLLSELLTGQAAEFEFVRQTIPYIGRHHRAPCLLPGDSRLIKTHEPYCRIYKKAIYLVRDCRDVVISEHSYQSMRGLYNTSFDNFLAHFLAGKVHGFGSWADHVNSWLGADLVDNTNLLVIKFENMRQNTEETCRKILDFLGVSVSIEATRNAIQNNSLHNMRKKEDAVRETRYREVRAVRTDLRFVNKGAVGGWRQGLNHQQVTCIEQQVGDTLARLGYPVGPVE